MPFQWGISPSIERIMQFSCFPDSTCHEAYTVTLQNHFLRPAVCLNIIILPPCVFTIASKLHFSHLCHKRLQLVELMKEHLTVCLDSSVVNHACLLIKGPANHLPGKCFNLCFEDLILLLFVCFSKNRNICLTSLTRAKCGTRSTLCWKNPNISGSI